MGTLLKEKEVFEGGILLEELKVKEEILYSGHAFCPSCDRIINANLVLRDGYLYCLRECDFENLKFENLILKTSGIKKSKITERPPFYWPRITKELPLGYKRKIKDCVEEFGIANIQHVAYVVLSLTSKCNLDCKICFEKVAPYKEDMELEQIKNIVKNFRKMPILLFGGEPTVKEDLPEIIFLIKDSGNFPILFTNGLKLADEDYLLIVKKAGLNTVCFTLDGFSYEEHGMMRGMDKINYEKKIEALKNLVKNNFFIRIYATLVRGLNEGQIFQLIDYACRNSQITELCLRPIWLRGFEEFGGFNKSHLLSASEIRNEVCEYLGFSEEYFEAWDDFKWAINNYLVAKFPHIKFPQFLLGQIYLKREKGRLIPLLGLELLRDLTEALEKNKLYKMMNFKNIRYFWELFLKILLKSNFIESDSFKKEVLRIAVRPFGSRFMLPDKESIILGLTYYSDGSVYPIHYHYGGKFYGQYPGQKESHDLFDTSILREKCSSPALVKDNLNNHVR